MCKGTRSKPDFSQNKPRAPASAMPSSCNRSESEKPSWIRDSPRRSLPSQPYPARRGIVVHPIWHTCGAVGGNGGVYLALPCRSWHTDCPPFDWRTRCRETARPRLPEARSDQIYLRENSRYRWTSCARRREQATYRHPRQLRAALPSQPGSGLFQEAPVIRFRGVES